MRIFLTGATGYIGGSLAERLVRDGHDVIGLARSAEKAAALRERGVEPVIGTLDDAPTLAAAARRADAVVNAADSDHRGAADTLIDALAGSGKPLLHGSGSSIVGDDARGEFSERVFTEADVAPGGGWRAEPDKAARVALDRAVLAAAERGVRAAVLCASLIYGHGRGQARDSVQVPRLVAQARRSGVVRHVGPGRNVWSTVHVDDVVEVYVRALAEAPPGAFYFLESGEASFGDIARAVAGALELGEPEPWDIDAAVREWGYERAHYALGSNSRVRGSAARAGLGWRPRPGSVLDWVGNEVR